MGEINNKKKGWIQGIIYSIVLFLVVYNPPVYAGLSFTTIAVVLSFIYIIFNSSVFSKVVRKKSIRHLFQLFALFFCYYLIEATVCYMASSREEIMSGLLSSVVSYISFFIVSFAIVIWSIKNGVTFEGLSKLYVSAGLLQTVLVVACLVSPSVKSFFNGLTMANSGSEKIARSMEYAGLFRNYGFASSLYDIFGFTMAVLGIMALNQALKGEKIYYVFSLLLALAAVVNARSAFVIYIFGFIILLLARRKGASAGWYLKIGFLIGVVFLGVYIIFNQVLGNGSSEHMMWLASGITETESLMNGQTEGYYDALFNDFLIFPEGLSLIFGEGMTPQVAIDHNSDVGYVQSLWLYGIVGSIFLYSFYVSMFKTAIKSLNWPNNSLMTAILLMIAIYMIKLTPLGYSQASVVFGPLCFLAAYQGIIGGRKVSS